MVNTFRQILASALDAWFDVATAALSTHRLLVAHTLRPDGPSLAPVPQDLPRWGEGERGVSS